MKTGYFIFIFAAAVAVAPLTAQETASPARSPARGSQPAANATGHYADDIVVVSDAQQQVLEQAQQMLAQPTGDHAALTTAVKEMQQAQAALASAKNSPDKLPAAIAAEQAAYQALLKAVPREFNVQRQRNNSRGQSSSSASGQPDQRQLDQLELTDEQNRYETERQATAPQNAQQRQQTQVENRLQELAQRQQDLNDRMRELQTALQAARTDQEREDIQRQLKHLADEQRQQLANVDELRQQLAQSPNASSQSDARKQLDQTRQDMERASEGLQNQSASQALAAGTRAQESMQNLRQDLRRQTSSQFSEQMRQLRNEARDLARQQTEITSNLDLLNNGDHQSLDDAAPRQQIVRQIARQQSTLTNLLAGMKDVTEQAETTEPLLSKQLYDTLRRADQMHTDNLLDIGLQLTDRGFLPQAGQAARAAGTNITEIASSVQRAADSVLGSEADALRYAQTQLDDLTRQVEREIGGGTNADALAAGEIGNAQGQSNRLARTEGRLSAENASASRGTNEMAGTNGIAPADESQLARNNSQSPQRGERDSANGSQNGNRGQQPNGGQASAGNQQNGARGARGDNQQQANNNSPGQENGSGQRGENRQQLGEQNGGDQQAANGAGSDADRLRQFAERLGRGDRAVDNGGPITGNDFVNWSDQLRDVQSVLDSPDLRNQLATVRDRAAGFRAAYRNGRQLPSADAVRQQILMPLAQVRVWVLEELSRQENANSLVPLDRDPVPENYSELVRQYYEKLGSAQ
jgi:hypothetical protein